MPSSSSRNPIVRDIGPAGEALQLRVVVERIAPAPKAYGRDTPVPLVNLGGTGGSRDVIRPLGRMLAARARTMPVRRPARRAAVPTAGPLLLDFSERLDAPTRKARRSAPFLLATSIVTAITLVSVAGIQLVHVGSAALGEAGLALEASQEGMRSLARATPAEASAHFDDARAHLDRTNELLGRVAVESRLTGLSPAEHSTQVVRAAAAATAAGTELSAAMSALDARELPEAFLHAERGLVALAEADEALLAVGPLLPENVRETAARASLELHAAHQRLIPLQAALPTLMAAAGKDGPRRYLILFQNDAELRGTGGFMGSFAALDFDGMRVTRFEFKDVYTVDWKQDDAPLPPAGLRRYYQTMRMRDANYAPDFPTAAQWIEWYYERSGGTTLDGIIAVDSQVFLDLLEALGPVTLPGTDTVLNHTNAIDLLTVRIETAKKDPAGPKDVLADLLPILTERLNDRTRWTAVAPVLDRAIAEKHLLAYAKDTDLQALLRAQGLEGAFPAVRANANELALVSTNVGGNKSDRFTNLQAAHHVTVRADGSVDAALTLTKAFRLPEDFDARIAPLLAGRDEKTRAYLRHVLGDGTNKDYLRVFLPLGTTVTAVDGLAKADWEVNEELGRTVVGLHLATQVGETRTVTLRYDLPMRLDFVSAATYRFRAIKQPGVIAQHLTHELTVEPGLTIVGASTRSVVSDLSGATDGSVAMVVTRG